MTLKTGRISTTDYSAFRDFVSRLDRALARRVRITWPAQSTTEAVR